MYLMERNLVSVEIIGDDIFCKKQYPSGMTKSLTSSDAVEVWDFVKGCDILVEDGKRFYRLVCILEERGVDYDFTEVNVVDIMSVEDFIAPRNIVTLSRQYHVEPSLLDIHRAQRLKSGMDAAELEKSVSGGMTRVDSKGFLKEKDGVVVFGSGKVKGVPVVSKPEFVQDVLKSNIPNETRKILENLFKR